MITVNYMKVAELNTNWQDKQVNVINLSDKIRNKREMWQSHNLRMEDEDLQRKFLITRSKEIEILTDLEGDG